MIYDLPILFVQSFDIQRFWAAMTIIIQLHPIPSTMSSHPTSVTSAA